MADLGWQRFYLFVGLNTHIYIGVVSQLWHIPKVFRDTDTDTIAHCSDPRYIRYVSRPTTVLSFSSPSLQWRLCVLNKTVQRLRDKCQIRML